MVRKNASPTNVTTGLVLQFLFNQRVFAWRCNVLPVPVYRGGLLTGLRAGSKQGLPDIMGIIPPGLLTPVGERYGIPLWIEIKTGNDRLRPEQIGAHRNAAAMGAIVLVIKDFQDYLRQWETLLSERSETI